jgi:hypothetical protein
MHVEISIDAHTREATFRRRIHPIDTGDLSSARKALDAACREARDWIDREIDRPRGESTR